MFSIVKVGVKLLFRILAMLPSIRCFVIHWTLHSEGQCFFYVKNCFRLHLTVRRSFFVVPFTVTNKGSAIFETMVITFTVFRDYFCD